MSTASEQAAQVQTLVHSLLAPLIVAAFLSALLCGIVLALSANYYSRFPNDKPIFKGLVAVLTVAAIIDTFCECAWPYHSATAYFMDPASLALWPWNYTEYFYLTGVVVLMCQGFFIWRVFVVSGQKSYVMTGLQVLLAVAGTVCCIYLGAWSGSQTSLAAFINVISVGYAWLSCWAGVDVLITGSMVYYLAVRPKTKRGADIIASSPLMRLVYLSFETNAVSMALQIITLGLVNWSTKENHIWYTIPGKVYIACVIVTLNARTSSAADSHASLSDPASRSKGLGARNFSRHPNSVQVHVTQDINIDESGEAFGRSQAALAPYEVNLAVGDDGSVSEMEKGGRGMY
ncbi:hypothetical protein JCM10213v2_009169 [Rhodosporidiobolus nylandii]